MTTEYEKFLAKYKIEKGSVFSLPSGSIFFSSTRGLLLVTSNPNGTLGFLAQIGKAKIPIKQITETDIDLLSYSLVIGNIS